MKNINAIHEKLKKYYIQTQKIFDKLYEMIILLNATYKNQLFANWNHNANKMFWSKYYWNVLKNLYKNYIHEKHDSNVNND